GRGFGLIVGIDLTHGGLDLERVERASACRQLLRSDHLGLTTQAHGRSVLKGRGPPLEAPALVQPQWAFHPRSVGWRVLPDAVVNAAPVVIIDDQSRNSCASH